MGNIVSLFPGLERVVVGFDSRDSMIRFDEDIAKAHMRHLLSSGILKYALWDSKAARDGYGNAGTWLRASPGSNDTQRVFFYPLLQRFVTHRL